jgi:hypothetical protein
MIFGFSVNGYLKVSPANVYSKIVLKDNDFLWKYVKIKLDLLFLKRLEYF